MKKLILPFFVLAAMNTMAQLSIPTYVPTDGLVGWWPFSGNANDLSGNNNNGVASNASLSVDRYGNANAAYSFNGSNSQINVADAASLRCRRITISAWVKCHSTTPINQIVYKGSIQAVGEAYSFSMAPGGNPSLGCKVNSNCETAVGWDAGTTDPQAITPDTWVHLVGTYDGATSKFYTNGILVDSGTGAGLIDDCIGGGLRFGFNHLRWFASTGDGFNGSIDDIGIWNRALTGNEISQLFISGYGGDCGYGNMGINVCNPQRNFHIKDVLRLEPRSTAPDNAGEGDIYYDSTLHKLRVFDGTQWQDCW